MMVCTARNSLVVLQVEICWSRCPALPNWKMIWRYVHTSPKPCNTATGLCWELKMAFAFRCSTVCPSMISLWFKYLSIESDLIWSTRLTCPNSSNLPIYLSVWRSVCLAVCLSVYLSISYAQFYSILFHSFLFYSSLLYSTATLF